MKLQLHLVSSEAPHIPASSDYTWVSWIMLIVWVKAPMTHCHLFEALDKTLKDIIDRDELFGGQLI